jgi:hypothetical protein
MTEPMPKAEWVEDAYRLLTNGFSAYAHPQLKASLERLYNRARGLDDE